MIFKNIFTFAIAIVSIVFGIQITSAFAAPKCIIFVHGHRESSEIKFNYSKVEDYWIGYLTWYFGDERTHSYGNGIDSATDRGYHYSYLVSYNPLQSYADAAVEVAEQMKRAMSGLPDSGGRRFCPTVSAGEPTQYIVVAHSMGGVITDFI